MQFEFSLLQIAVFTLCVLITGTSKSGFAGGLGIITVPLLTLVMSPVLAVSLMLPTLIIMDILSLRVWRGKHHATLTRQLIPSGIVGVLIGYFLFSGISEQAIKVLLGVVSILFSVNGLTKAIKLTTHHPLIGLLLGSLGGFTSFVAHAGGPPLNMYLLGQKITKEQYLGTAVAFFAAINLAKVPPYIALGQFTAQNLLVALLFFPVSFIGIKLGVMAQKRINEALFFKLIYLLLLLLGGYLVIQ